MLESATNKPLSNKPVTNTPIANDFAHQEKLLFAFCMLLPFAVFYWLVPAFSGLTIGNDYLTYPIESQMALAYSLEYGSFPLYAPGFAMGQSAAALTLGQIYHPIFYLANLMPGYWDGSALTISTQLRLASLGLANYILFFALRRLGLKNLIALILAFITVYNLRMLDHFRYGASLENHTAFLMLGSFILLSFLEPQKRGYNAGVLISSYLLMVGGHPQIAYIGFLGAGLFTLLIPFVVKHLKGEERVSKEELLAYWGRMFVFTVIGLLLAAPYILGFYTDYLLANTTRTENDYQWSLAYQDTVGGTLRSFYAPLQSAATGAFGTAAIAMLLFVFPIIALWTRKASISIWIAFALCVLAVLISVGNATPVHKLMWEYFPMASKFRVPGRYSMLLIFPMLLVLVWLVSSDKLTGKALLGAMKSNVALAFVIALLLFLLVNLSIDHMLPDTGRYAPSEINQVSPSVYSYVFYLGIAVLLLGAVYFEVLARMEEGALASGLGFVFLVLVIASVALIMRHGTWMVEAQPVITKAKLDEMNQSVFRVHARPGFGMTSGEIDQQLERSMVEPRMARFYRKVTSFASEAELEVSLVSTREADEAFVLNDKKQNLEGTANTNQAHDTIVLLEAHYNHLLFEVDAKAEGFFATNLPYRDNWKASIGEESIETYKANGYELGAFVPAGKHLLHLRYESSETYYGMLVACITLLGVILYFAKVSENPKLSRVLLAFALIPLVLFWCWQHSLYGGEPISSEYRWSSAEFPNLNNIAYGKKAESSSVWNPQMKFYFYPGLAVDGQVGDNQFVSGHTQRPSWKVDLAHVYDLEKIIIHGLIKESVPMRVWVSNDNRAFKPVARITSTQPVIELPVVGAEARFVAISSEKQTVLGFKEVEVYGTVK